MLAETVAATDGQTLRILKYKKIAMKRGTTLPLLLRSQDILQVDAVTGQLADTPTRGLPTRGLDISRTR